jgi:hypothetical protein
VAMSRVLAVRNRRGVGWFVWPSWRSLKREWGLKLCFDSKPISDVNFLSSLRELLN